MIYIHIRDSSIAYMVIRAPELSAVFRSDAQGELVALLLLNPERAFTVAELARTTGTAYARYSGWSGPRWCRHAGLAVIIR